MEQKWTLNPDRFFDPDPAQCRAARSLYQHIAGLPIISPHGHVDPALFASEKSTFGSPVDLLILPDHYVLRMLVSQGHSLEALGVPRRDGGPVEQDHRCIWQCFGENFHLFRGTPSGIWLAHELVEVLGVTVKLTGETAQVVYDQIASRLSEPDFKPRALFEQFKIEVLCTTDEAADPLSHHQRIRQSGWQGCIRPTFRPDGVINLDTPDWQANLAALGAVCGQELTTCHAFIQALEQRRTHFKHMGAVAADHGCTTVHTEVLTEGEAESIFQRALKNQSTADDALRFTGHMLIEMARMSVEDGLVMQLHPGSYRNHSASLFTEFGPNKGADIPVQGEFTRGLRALLDRFGRDPRLGLILFTLDETTYARELAPLASIYSAVKIGPPWWFHDSLNGMRRYFDQVMETAGIYNTAGFNDDTRAFLSIPARHDVWRRASANWLAGLVVRHMIEEEEAAELAYELAYRRAKLAYRLDSTEGQAGKNG